MSSTSSQYSRVSKREAIRIEMNLAEVLFRQKLELSQVGIVLPLKHKKPVHDLTLYINGLGFFTALSTLGFIINPGMFLSIEQEKLLGISQYMNIFNGLYYFGAMVAAFGCLRYCTYRRRRMVLFATVLTVPALFLMGNIYSFSVVMAMRLIEGFGAGIEVVAAAYLCAEFSDFSSNSKYSIHLFAVYSSLACISTTLFLGISFYWRTVVTIITLLRIATSFAVYLLPESPYVLMYEGKPHLAREIIRDLTTNRKKFSLEYKRIENDLVEVMADLKLKEYGMLDIFPPQIMNIMKIYVCDQLTGVNNYMLYLAKIMEYIDIQLMSSKFSTFFLSARLVIVLYDYLPLIKTEQRLPVIKMCTYKMGCYSVLFGFLIFLKAKCPFFKVILGCAKTLALYKVFSHYYSSLVIIPNLACEESLSYSSKLYGIPLLFTFKFLLQFLLALSFPSSLYGVGVWSIIYGSLSIMLYRLVGVWINETNPPLKKLPSLSN